MSRAPGFGASSARRPLSVACDDSMFAGLDGCNGGARPRPPPALSPDAPGEAPVCALSPPPSFADTLASIVGRTADTPSSFASTASTPSAYAPATGGFLPDVVPRPPTIGGGWQANGRRYVESNGNKSDLRHTDHRGYSSLEGVLNGEASAATPRTPAAHQKRQPQFRKFGKKIAKPNTMQHQGMVGGQSNAANPCVQPQIRRQSITTKGGFLWRAEDEDGDPEEEAEKVMARHHLRTNFLGTDWSFLLADGAAEKTDAPRPADSKPKEKARLRSKERPETATENAAVKESLMPGVYQGHGQLRVPAMLSTLGVQANVALIDGGPNKSSDAGPRKSARWHSKLNDREVMRGVMERDSLQGVEPSSWHVKPPKGEKQQLVQMELPPDDQGMEDGRPKEEDRKAYLQWRKKVIECARSMALEVDRFRSVVQ